MKTNLTLVGTNEYGNGTSRWTVKDIAGNVIGSVLRGVKIYSEYRLLIGNVDAVRFTSMAKLKAHLETL